MSLMPFPTIGGLILVSCCVCIRFYIVSGWSSHVVVYTLPVSVLNVSEDFVVFLLAISSMPLCHSASDYIIDGGFLVARPSS